jgi:segregation and condensation protein A
MAQVTRQYLAYIDQIRQGGSARLELVADYLVMAATLIEIKSRMLLPPRPRPGDEEPEDPRAELVRRLIEYEQMKQAAADLDALPQHGREFLTPRTHVMLADLPRLPEVSADDLRAAWAGVLARARLVKHHHIEAETLSVREIMGQVLRRLQGCRIAEFSELFELDRGTSVLVVTFIALLELAREQLIELTQAEAFAPIYVRLGYSASRLGADAP